MPQPTISTTPSGAIVRRRTYRPGYLRAALVEAALALISERGVEALTVAELTRRLGISSSNPYQHFATRQDLLVATAVQAARELVAEMESAVGDVQRRWGQEANAVDAFAATGVAYATFVAKRRAGLDFIFAQELTCLRRDDLVEAGRAVVDLLLPLAEAITGNNNDALRLIDNHMAAAHGLGVLYRGGLTRNLRDGAALSAEAARVAYALAAAVGGQAQAGMHFVDDDVQLVGSAR